MAVLGCLLAVPMAPVPGASPAHASEPQTRAGPQTAETPPGSPAESAVDASLRHAVLKQLSGDVDTRYLEILAEVRHGVLILSGEVENLASRDDVKLLAGRVRGLRGLRDELRVRPVEGGDTRLRDVVFRQVKAALRGARVEVEVKNGVATLRGRVRTTKERADARNRALRVSGLQGLDNQLLVVSEAGLDDTQLRVRLIELLENRLLYPIEGNISVHVQDGVVTLSGEVARVFDRLVAGKVVGIVSRVRGLRNEIQVVPSPGGHITGSVLVRP
ncbi:MAG: BON domain-containing protein [Acidobacteriota bacterium]